MAQASSQEDQPHIAPIHSRPAGKTYSEWAATWWQWALQIPASVNPLLNKGDCSVGQQGRVWFIGGTLDGSVAATRDCTIPAGTSLFFPLINASYFAFLNAPPEQRTEEFLRSNVKCDVPTVLQAKIDGVPVKNPTKYFEESPLFDVQLPTDNVYGLTESVVPQLLLSPGVDQGYYLFLRPLEPGKHSINWQATISCPSNLMFSQNISYNIVVQSKRDR